MTKPVIKDDYWVRARLNISQAFPTEVKWVQAETPAAAATDTRPYNYVIEYCCGPESFIGKYVREDCWYVRLTIENDLTTESGFKHAQECFRKAIEGGGSILLWVAIPCTGGSPWQNYNKQFPNARKLIREHIRVYITLFNNLVRLTSWVRGLQTFEGTRPNFSFYVALEWPKECSYWRDERVQHYVTALGLQSVVVNGCRVNLRSVVNNELIAKLG